MFKRLKRDYKLSLNKEGDMITKKQGYYAYIRGLYSEADTDPAISGGETNDESEGDEPEASEIAMQAMVALQLGDPSQMKMYVVHGPTPGPKEQRGVARWAHTFTMENPKHLPTCMDIVRFGSRHGIVEAKDWVCMKPWAAAVLATHYRQMRGSNKLRNFLEAHEDLWCHYIDVNACKALMAHTGDWSERHQELQIMMGSDLGQEIWGFAMPRVASGVVTKKIRESVEALMADTSSELTKADLDAFHIRTIAELGKMPEIKNLTARRVITYKYRSYTISNVKVTSYRQELSRVLAANIRGAAVEQGKLSKLAFEDILSIVDAHQNHRRIKFELVKSAEYSRREFDQLMKDSKAGRREQIQHFLASKGHSFLASDSDFQVDLDIGNDLVKTDGTERMQRRVLELFPTKDTARTPQQVSIALSTLCQKPLYKLTAEDGQEQIDYVIGLVTQLAQNSQPAWANLPRGIVYKGVQNRFAYFVRAEGVITPGEEAVQLVGTQALEVLFERDVVLKYYAGTLVDNDMDFFTSFQWLLSDRVAGLMKEYKAEIANKTNVVRVAKRKKDSTSRTASASKEAEAHASAIAMFAKNRRPQARQPRRLEARGAVI